MFPEKTEGKNLKETMKGKLIAGRFKSPDTKNVLIAHPSDVKTRTKVHYYAILFP